MELPSTLSELIQWDRLDPSAVEKDARRLGQHLPAGWRFARVEMHEAMDRRRAVAFYDWDGVEFALIPGGAVTLGYDPSVPPDLSQQDLEDWERARYEYGDLSQHLLATMTPLRDVVLAPFLIEVASREMNTVPNWVSGRIVGTRTIHITVGQVREWACKDGFSLPTSDQWEHACRSGTRSFWWWGNAVRFPLPERNGFGLQIAWDTYRSEWCTDPDAYRGGDGGCASHGGLDGLPTAIRLASAYFEPFDEAGIDGEQFMGDCRRVYLLPLE